MLEREIVIAQRTVLEDGEIHVREATYIKDTDTGKRIAGPNSRIYVLYPGNDVTGQPESILRIVAVEWTPDVIRAFQEKMEKLRAGTGFSIGVNRAE